MGEESRPWDGLSGNRRRSAMRDWLRDRGWVNHGGRDGVFVLDELGEDGPSFSVVGAVDFEEAGRPQPRPRPTLESVPDPDRSLIPVGVGGGTPGLDPWVGDDGLPEVAAAQAPVPVAETDEEAVVASGDPDPWESE